MGVEIRLLGELEVRHGGRAQRLPASKKSRALLAYLAATARPHLREMLCLLLWDGPDDPRAELRWCLSKIRPLLEAGGGHLTADRERVCFVPGPVRVDSLAVRALLAGGVEVATTDTLREAAGLFRGEPLEGLDLPTCYRYHEWCVGEREGLRGLRAGVVAELVNRLAGAGDDLPEALRWARQRVNFDPLAEAGHVDVIRILGRLGRTREALAQYDSCRRILESELGARVSSALERARRELSPATTAPADPSSRGSSSSDGVPSSDGATGQPGASPVAGAGPPLVGRDAIRSAIEATVIAARDGAGPPALLLAGDPGIGKTRLLDLVAERTRALGGTVLRGRAFEAETVRPYGPWIDALATATPPASVVAALAAGAGSALVPLIPGLAVPAPGTSAAADRGALHDAVRALLERWSASAGPLAVVLDDVQWLDEASASLLHYVARAAAGGRLVLACAARAGELGDNPAALRVVRTLDRERRLVQHPLEPLGPAETAAIVRAVNPEADVSAAFAASEGNPLFAIEIARAAAAGAPTRDEPLAHLLDDRLERLGEAAREIVPWAAALGRSFDPDLLARARGKASGDLVEGLEQLERHGIIRATAGGDCDFTHDLVRRAAYRRLSESRRRLVHLQIARGLQAARADGDDELAGEVAHHAALGGDALLAAESAVSAGHRCVRMFAYAEAAALVNRGLQQLHRVERLVRIRLQIELYALLVNAGRGTAKMPSLEADLSRAIVEAQEAGLHAQAAAGFRARAMLYYTGERFDAARESSIRAVEEIGRTDALTRGRELAVSARCLLLLEKEIPQAQAMIGEARLLLGPETEQIPILAWAAALAAHYSGDHATADTACRVAIAGFEREQAHWERSQAITQRVKLALERGDTAEARVHCQALAEVASRMTDGSEAATAAALTAVAERAECPGGVPTPESTARLDQTIGGLVAADSKAMLAYVLNVAAAQDLAAGDLPGAASRAGAALEAATAVGRRSELAVARSLLGRMALARGDTAQARQHLEAIGGQDGAPLSRRAAAAVDELAAALATRAPRRRGAR